MERNETCQALPPTRVPFLGHSISWWSEFDARQLARWGYSGSGVLWRRTIRILGRRAKVTLRYEYHGEDDDHFLPACQEGRLDAAIITFDTADGRFPDRLARSIVLGGFEWIRPTGMRCGNEIPVTRFTDSITNIELLAKQRQNIYLSEEQQTTMDLWLGDVAVEIELRPARSGAR